MIVNFSSVGITIVFFNFQLNLGHPHFYTIQNHDVSKRDLNGFQFRRIYFTYDHTISPAFESRLRIEADQITLTNSGKFTFFVKDAYLRWNKAIFNSDITLGLSPNPGFELIEEAWGYRSLEKTILDLQGASSTRDIGISAAGRLSPGGSFTYAVKIGNNSNTSPEADKYKRYYGHIQFRASSQLCAQVYTDFESAAPTTDSVMLRAVSNHRMTVDALINLHEGGAWSISAEYMYRTIQHGFKPGPLSPLTSLNCTGVSLFGWYAIANEHRVVARFDLYDPNTASGQDRRYLVIGAYDYIPEPEIHIMPNVEFGGYQNAAVQSDLTARLTVSYSYQ